jgi:polar amino acid transport system permease protein
MQSAPAQPVGPPGEQGTAPESLPVDAVPVRHYGQALTALVVMALLVMLAVAVYQNKNIDHQTIEQYLFSRAILNGLVVTIKLTVLSVALGAVLGTLLAVFRLSGNRILAGASWLYIWAFRGTPLLVQILIWGNFGLLFKHLQLGIPFTHVIWVSVNTNTVLTGFVASILGLGLNESAYMAEVVRGGILAIDPGQAEAARAMGMSRPMTMRRIVLPQALRVIIPPTGNQLINLLKASSLVSVIAGGDLLTVADNISAANLRVIELLLVATFWYFIIVSVTSVGQFFLERRLARKQVL